MLVSVLKRGVKLHTWRANVLLVFQIFMRYHLLITWSGVFNKSEDKKEDIWEVKASSFFVSANVLFSASDWLNKRDQVIIRNCNKETWKTSRT